MQTYAVEARRNDGPWMPVTTVQEDLVDFVAETLIDLTEEGDSTSWRVRSDDPDVQHPKVAPAPQLPRPSRWERVRWWAMMRFSRRGRR